MAQLLVRHMCVLLCAAPLAQLRVSHVCVLLWAAQLAQLRVRHMCVLLWAGATYTSDWNFRCVFSFQIFLLLGHPCQILLRL